ncbi:phage tail protein [Photobacterium piscicola]|uniref:phage tail-collar fiber domain-containing protein n=1 Tax=Photobacterium piscicola TaxID=1378299 RepID=UPI003734C631
MSNFQQAGILTTVGENKLNAANAGFKSLKLKQIVLGDGGGTTTTPSKDQVSLVNEFARLAITGDDPDVICAKAAITLDIASEHQGKVLREVGIIDEDDHLIAVLNYNPMSIGLYIDITLEIYLPLLSSSNTTVIVDLTKKYVTQADFNELEAEVSINTNAVGTLATQQALTAAEVVKKLDINGKAKSAAEADHATGCDYLIYGGIYYTPRSFAATNGFVAPAPPSWHPKTLNSSATSFFVFIQNTSAATSSTYVQCRLVSVADNIYINFSIAFKMDNGDGINAMLIIESATPESPDLTASIGKSIRDRKSPSININLSRALNNPLFTVTAIQSSVARLGSALYVDNGRDTQIGNSLQATIIKL